MEPATAQERREGAHLWHYHQLLLTKHSLPAATAQHCAQALVNVAQHAPVSLSVLQGVLQQGPVCCPFSFSVLYYVLLFSTHSTVVMSCM
jgi:hypothetical protein